jgi:hypothetical protein
MGPRNAYKDMLDNVVSLIACISMNHQNQLEQMANEAMFATHSRVLHPFPDQENVFMPIVEWWRRDLWAHVLLHECGSPAYASSPVASPAGDSNHHETALSVLLLAR